MLLPTNSLAAWTLDVTAGALLNAELGTRTPSAWTPGLYILDPSGQIIARGAVSNTPGATGAPQNTLDLVGTTAPVTGRYRLIVAGTVAAAFASYQLTANVQTPFTTNGAIIVNQSALTPVARFAPAPTDTPLQAALAELIEPALPAEKINAPDVQPLPLNTLERGEIVPGTLRQLWHVLGQTGGTLSIRAVSLSDGNAPDLMLFDRNGKLVAQQQHSDAPDTTLTYRTVQSGDFVLAVRTGLRTGRYTLYGQSLTLKAGALTVSPGTPIVYGQSLQGELRTSEQADAYYFFGAANEVITAQVARTNGDLVPALQIVTPTGTALAADANAASHPVSQLANVRISTAGVYAVIVRHTDTTPKTTGRYLISLDVVSGSRLKNRLSGILTPGQTVTGALILSGNENTWLIQGHAGERISLVASALAASTSGGPTPLGIRLMDTAGNIFASQDVFLPQDAARLSGVMLPADGIYRVQVIGGGQSQGGYQLTWLTERAQQIPGALRYSQTVGGVFTTAHNADTWTFTGKANDVIAITLQSVRGDPFKGGFQLVAANGVVLAPAVDLGDDGGARVDNILLPFSGAYRIIVANPDSAFRGAGVYALSLTLEDSKARSLGAILYDGARGDGDLYPDDPNAAWLFAGHGGDVINARVQARDHFLTPVLTLQNTSGQTLSTASVDASGIAAISAFKLPADSVYVLTVEGANKSTGSYRIGLDFVPPPAPALGLIRYGSNVVGLVADDRVEDVHRFSGQQGDRIAAKVTREPGSQLATVLDLYTERGDLLVRADALGQDDATITDFILPSTGTYRLVATRYRGALGLTSGRLTVTLNGTAVTYTTRGKLNPGQKSVGRLDDATPTDRWTFNGKAGEVISVTSKATSGDLDTFLTLQAPGGVVIATNDDFDGSNAVLTGVTLPTDGIYLITLSRVGVGTHGSSGNYDLRADNLFTLGATKTPQAVIAYGQRVVGTLDPAHVEARWTFAANQGDTLSIQVIHATDDAPPLLSLQDPTGVILASGSLSAGQTRLDNFRVPAGGLFDVVVKRPSDAKLVYTPYALTLSLLSSPNNAPSGGGILAPNGSTIGSVQPGQAANFWLIDGSVGQTLTLEVQTLTGNLSPTLLLISPGGQALAAQTLSPGATSVLIDHLRLALSGVYTVIIIPGGADLTGTYRLNTRSMFDTPAEVRTLSADQNVQGTLSDVHAAERWQITVTKGQAISARMLATGGDLQPVLQLVNADGQIVAQSHSDQTLLGTMAIIDPFAIPADGTYQLVAMRADRTTGTYTLSFSAGALAAEPLAAAPLSYGQTVQSVVGAAKPGLWMFTGKAGDAINLIALPGASDQVPALTLIDAGGRVLAHADPGAKETNLQAIVLPADGRYVITLAANSTIAYALTLERRQDALPSTPTGRILVSGTKQQNGILPTNLTDYWTFPGKADSTIQIAAERVDGTLRLDVTLFAPGPNGSYRYLSSVTADATTGTLTLGPVKLPSDGSYQLVVGRWRGVAGKTTGRYSLLLSDTSGAASTPPPSTPIPTASASALAKIGPQTPQPGMTDQGEIAPGTDAVGYLDAGQFGHQWTFTAQSSPTIAVALNAESAGLRLRVLIIRADRTLIGKAESDANGDLTLEAALPASDSPALYTLLILPDVQGQAGYYHFTLAYALAPTGGGLLIPGETVNGTITDTDFTDGWRIRLRAAQILILDASRTSGDLTLNFELLDVDGTVIAGDAPIPHDGIYTLVASREGGALGLTTGTYRLRVVAT